MPICCSNTGIIVEIVQGRISQNYFKLIGSLKKLSIVLFSLLLFQVGFMKITLLHAILKHINVYFILKMNPKRLVVATYVQFYL